MGMSKDEAQGIANEALRAIATDPGFYNLKDLIGRELDITDVTLDEAVKVLFSKTEIVLDAKRYSTWINGITTSLETSDFFKKRKTLWDLPFTYLPKYVFVSGFEIAQKRLPSDGSGVQISEQVAKELNISWANVPGGSQCQ
jgi:hypothetical protein